MVELRLRQRNRNVESRLRRKMGPVSDLVIQQVSSKNQRTNFIKSAWEFYKEDPCWVPPIIADQKTFLDPKKGVFFDHGEARLFLASRDGRPVGRISGHVNHLHEEKYNDGTGFFGFFECEDNQETANTLFHAAEDYLKSRGKTHAEGPLSFGIYDEVGTLVEGFETDPYLLCVHNPPYYPTLIKKAGYRKSADWFAFRGLLADYVKLPPRLHRVRDLAMKRSGLDVRRMNTKDPRKDTEILKSIFNTAWDENWRHVPFTDREFDRLYHELVRVAIPELTLVAQKNSRPVGIILTTYDANVAVKKVNGRLFPLGFITLLNNLKKTDKIRLILLGVLKEFRGRGIETAMMMLVAEEAFQAGYREMEMSLIVENNQPMLKALRYFPVHKEKVWRVYRKKL